MHLWIQSAKELSERTQIIYNSTISNKHAPINRYFLFALFWKDYVDRNIDIYLLFVKNILKSKFFERKVEVIKSPKMKYKWDDNRV